MLQAPGAEQPSGALFGLVTQRLYNFFVNTLRPRQHGRHFADDTFKRIFLNENVIISIKISLKFVPKDPINNIPALVQIMAWRRPGDKPLSEAMMVSLVSLLTHVCVTRPQWVKCFGTDLIKKLSPFIATEIWCLQHWGLSKMTEHFQIKFHEWKFNHFLFLFHWSLFLGVWLAISRDGSRNDLNLILWQRGPLSLTKINYKPKLDIFIRSEITYPFQNFNARMTIIISIFKMMIESLSQSKLYTSQVKSSQSSLYCFPYKTRY